MSKKHTQLKAIVLLKSKLKGEYAEICSMGDIVYGSKLKSLEYLYLRDCFFSVLELTATLILGLLLYYQSLLIYGDVLNELNILQEHISILVQRCSEIDWLNDQYVNLLNAKREEIQMYVKFAENLKAKQRF